MTSRQERRASQRSTKRKAAPSYPKSTERGHISDTDITAAEAEMQGSDRDEDSDLDLDDQFAVKLAMWQGHNHRGALALTNYRLRRELGGETTKP